METQEVKYAGFWIRVGAALLDYLACIILIFINVMSLYFWKNIPLIVLANLALMVYKPLMEFKYAATLGKMALRIKVLRSNNTAISLTQAFLRSFPVLLTGILNSFSLTVLISHPLFFQTTGFKNMARLQADMPPLLQLLNIAFAVLCIVSVIIVPFNRRKRGLHDMVADTVVVHH